jgi:hypothetical protein
MRDLPDGVASGVYRLKEYRHGGSCPRTAPPGARDEKHLSRDTALCARWGAPFAATRDRR